MRLMRDSSGGNRLFVIKLKYMTVSDLSWRTVALGFRVRRAAGHKRWSKPFQTSNIRESRTTGIEIRENGLILPQPFQQRSSSTSSFFLVLAMMLHA